MEDAAHDVERDVEMAFATLIRVANELDAGRIELYLDRHGHINFRKRVAPSSSFLDATLYMLLTYFIGIVVATYTLVQATEAISFILSLNTGIVLKVAWLAFISVCGVLIVILIASDVEDNVGPVNFPRWMAEAFD
jgi:hypothetical protein